MREFLNFVFRLTWVMPLMAWKQFANMFSPDAAGGTPDSGVIHAGGAADTQPDMTNISVPDMNVETAPAYSRVVNGGGLDVSRMVVLGEGLAAGVGDFSFSAETQPWSFPAQMARQMAADFPQRLIQAPGLENGIGFGSLPVRIPAPLQSTVLDQLPPGRVQNLSIPGFRLDDALELRP